jgi:hypothetical protein
MVWFVVADPYCNYLDDPEACVWTLSEDPAQPGWRTDSGAAGYGLTKARAQFLADCANDRGSYCFCTRP